MSYRSETDREAESRRVWEFIKEVTGQPFDHNHPTLPSIGPVARLDQDTAMLCEWCATHDISKQSLGLQLWWAHQALRKQALAKLTQEELDALGLRRS